MIFMLRKFAFFFIFSFYFFAHFLCNFLHSEDCANCLLSINDAISLTLKNQKEIQIHNEEINVQGGILRQDAGPFDPVANARATERHSRYSQRILHTPKSKIRATIKDSHLDASITKKTRLGTNYSFTALVGNVRTHAHPSLFSSNINTYLVSFQVDQPLLRGYKYSLDTMIEQAQSLEVSSAWYSAVYFITSRINNTAIHYWDVVAAKQIIGIQEEAEKRMFDLGERLEKLIKAELAPASDINQPLAQLATRKIDVLVAKQQYYNAIQNLKFSMGVGDQCFDCDCSKIETENFPIIQEDILPNFSCAEMLEKVNFLSQNRYDIVASEIHSQAIALLIKGSQNESLPRLDVFGNVTYDKNSEVINTPLYLLDAKRFDISGGIIYSQPLYNDRALGLVQQRKAELIQNQLQTLQLKEEMSVRFFETWSDHLYLIAELNESEIAVKRYHLLVEKELKKLSAGYSTVFIVIDFQNRLTDALIRQVELYREYAQNIADFRFVTGTLLKFEDFNDICVESLTIWPKLY